MEYVIQGIGLLGAVFAFIAFQCKKHFFIMLVKACSALCFVVQFALMGAYTGLAMNALGILMMVTNAILVSKNVKTLPSTILFLIAAVTLGILSWMNATSLLAIAGKVIITIACGIKDPKRVKYFYFFGSVCWLIYDCFFFTLGGIITEVFTISSIIIATVQLIRAKKKETKAEEQDKTNNPQ